MSKAVKPEAPQKVDYNDAVAESKKYFDGDVYADAPVVDQFVDELTINPASWVIYHLFNLKLVFWHSEPPSFLCRQVVR